MQIVLIFKELAVEKLAWLKATPALKDASIQKDASTK